MNPYRAYQQQAYSAWLRIDMLLALYDGLIGKLEAARAALVKRDVGRQRTCSPGRGSCSPGWSAPWTPSRGEMAVEFLRLYEFVNHSLGVGDVKSIDAALKVLRTLREGLEEIRPEAAELERSGRIPPAGDRAGVQMMV